ncbi:hypothetical protein FQN60_002463 [Etheostoma spectabile]|uniref:Uncharacterized protein n=1 Tax=Etheostoma spectabile TaxID=54343 RepID=A0A5J5C8N7_9PERO|nr:hypothetical protein FQN60_002463 [Etheostoma spectabile]
MAVSSARLDGSSSSPLESSLDCVFEESGSDSFGSESCSHTELDPDYNSPLKASSSSDEEHFKSPGKAKKLSSKEDLKSPDTNLSEFENQQGGKPTRKDINPISEDIYITLSPLEKELSK